MSDYTKTEWEWIALKM